MRATLACWRLLRCAVHLMHGALICSFAFPFLKPARRLQLVGWWCARLLDQLGVALRVIGTPRRRATLVVANHISWLDILVMHAQLDVPIKDWLIISLGDDLSKNFSNCRLLGPTIGPPCSYFRNDVWLRVAVSY